MVNDNNDIEIKEFETAEEAVEYLKSEDSDIEEARVGVRTRDRPEPTPVGRDELESRNPDLPVAKWDRTHQVLWLLNKYGGPLHGFTNHELVALSDDDTLIKSRPSPATNALFQAGYANRTEKRPYVYVISPAGAKRLEQLGNPDNERAFYADDVQNRNLVTAANALEGDW